MTMALERMSADKSHLLAYLHHTPGFEHRIREFIELPINEILPRVRESDEPACRTCTARFRQQGTELEPNAETLTAMADAASGNLANIWTVTELIAELNEDGSSIGQ